MKLGGLMPEVTSKPSHSKNFDLLRYLLLHAIDYIESRPQVLEL